MKKILLAFLLLLAPASAFGQGSRFDSVAQRNVQGFLAPIAGATITVCTSSATGTPCTPVVPTSPVTLCTDSTCSTAAANPFLGDSNGNWGFWALPGTYKVSITAPGVTGQLITVTLPCASGTSCVATGANNTFTGSNTFTGAVTATGAFTCKQFDGDFCVDPANAAGWVGANASAWLNAAIAAAAASGIGGAHVHVFPGNYNLTANVNLASKVSVDCPGGWANTTLTWTGGAGPNAMLIGGSINDFAVRNCHLVGPNATTSGTSDVRGIEIDGTSRGDVEYNKITGMSYGIFETSGGSDMQINNNWIQTCTTQGIVTYDSHVKVHGNRIDTIGTSALHHGIYASGGADQVIEANQISNIQGFCIQGFASVTPQVNTEVKIIGNGCEAGGQASSSARGGIIVGFGGTSTAGSEFIVQGNTITNIGSGTAIQIGDGRNFIISGNVVRNHGAGDMIVINSSLAAGIQGISITGNILDTNANTGSSGNGIVCSPGTGGVKNITITGNQISSIAFHGIKINGCLDGTITGNEIFNFNLQNASANGIDLESGATGWTIGHNRARSTAATGFGVGINTGAVDNTVQGNIDLNAAGAFYDNGTRTIIYGEKINSTDKNFRSPSTIEGLQHISDQGVACTNGELALSAGWGTTATVTAVVGQGQTCEWTLTSSGTGQAANPTITDTLTNVLPSASVTCDMRMTGGTGTATLIDQTTLSATVPVFTFGGTPVAASTYKVVRRCGP